MTALPAPTPYRPAKRSLLRQRSLRMEGEGFRQGPATDAMPDKSHGRAPRARAVSGAPRRGEHATTGAARTEAGAWPTPGRSDAEAPGVGSTAGPGSICRSRAAGAGATTLG